MAFFNTLGSSAKSGFNSLMRAREKEAQLSVHAYLSNLDDVALTRLGVSRSQLKQGGSVNFFM
ncbi:MAG: hypothetical protein AAF217_08565 [Pseudomonadota bacterium]